MLLDKILRTLRREGVRGLLTRLRHPKAMGNPQLVTPQQCPPFRLNGTDPKLTETIADALTRVLGPGATTRDSKSATIHLSPTDPAADYGPQDVLLFDQPAAVLAFLGDQAGTGHLACGAILLPTEACLLACRKAGFGEGRLFLAPSLCVPGQGDLAGDLARWLVAAGALSPDRAPAALFPALRRLKPQDRLCLGLPESNDRRSGFLQSELKGFRLFDGLRLTPAWQGCAWSYVTIARAALAQRAVPLLICEDDMRPGPGFHDRLTTIEAYLSVNEWDLFSGLLSNASDHVSIRKIEQRGDLTFIHLDYATGMVLNIYGRRALARLADWRPERGGPETNTIDTWLSQMPELRVITTLPFVARHDSRSISTIFGFSNRRYDSLIRASERNLARRVADHLAKSAQGL